MVFNSHVVSPLRCGVNRWAIAQERDERLAGASLGRAGVIEIHGKKRNTSNGYDDEENPVSYKYYKQSPVTYTIIHNIYIYTTYEPVPSGGLSLGFATFCFPFLALELLLVDVKPW